MIYEDGERTEPASAAEATSDGRWKKWPAIITSKVR